MFKLNMHGFDFSEDEMEEILRLKELYSGVQVGGRSLDGFDQLETIFRFQGDFQDVSRERLLTTFWQLKAVLACWKNTEWLDSTGMEVLLTKLMGVIKKELRERR